MKIKDKGREAGRRKNLQFGMEGSFEHFNPFVLMVPGASMVGTGTRAGKIQLPKPTRSREGC
jgi:hypothetical protein